MNENNLGEARPDADGLVDDSRSVSAVSPKRAGFVTLTGQLVKATTQFSALIVFSHLLTPRDVGLFAMVAIFQMLGDLLRDFGLSQAGIQAERLTHGQATNLFWSNTAIGVTITVAFVACAPIVATMYHEPALREITPWVALSFSISALQTQFQVRLVRQLRFVALAVTDALSQVIGLAAGVAAAIIGMAYWALVIQVLAVYASLLIQRVAIAQWLPGLPRREGGMRALYLFGLHSALAQLLNYVAYNTDSYIVGIRWGASTLGFYNRAFQLSTVPANQVVAPLTNVALPILSRRYHERRDFYELLWKAQIALTAVLTLGFAVLGSLAEHVIRIALGTAWVQASSLLSILCIAGAFQVLSYVAYWAFLASGNSKQLLIYGITSKPLIVGCIIVGSVFGPKGIAAGFAFGMSVSWVLSLIWLKRCANLPLRLFLTGGVHILFAGVVAAAGTRLAVSRLSAPVPEVGVLLAGGLVALLLYVPVVLASPSIRLFLVQTSRPAFAKAKAIVATSRFD